MVYKGGTNVFQVRILVKSLVPVIVIIVLQLMSMSVYASPVMKALDTLGNTTEATSMNEKGQIVGRSLFEGSSKSHSILWENGKMRDLDIDIDISDDLYSCARDINEKEQVVGETYYTETRRTRAFIWENGVKKELGTLDGYTDSRAFRINEKGQVIGGCSTIDAISRPFIWENGVMKDLGTPEGASSTVCDINEKGQIIGNCHDSDSSSRRAFIWENGVINYLGQTGEYSVFARVINEKGQVIGYYEVKNEDNVKSNHAFIWENGVMKDLGTLGGDNSYAYDINEKGQVVGCSEVKKGDKSAHAFIWENGVMKDLGTMGGNNSKAYDINEKGQVVGDSEIEVLTNTRLEPPRPLPPAKHAFIWENGVMRDLGTLGGINSSALGINEKGQIFGKSNVSGPYEEYAFLWEDGDNPPESRITISGYIKADVDSNYSLINADIYVRVLNSVYYTQTDSQGFFKINLPAIDGFYNIKISKYNYLARDINNIPGNKDVQLGTLTEPISIWAGDILRDGAINIADVLEIAKAFNTPSDYFGIVDTRDFNMDGAINIMDIMLVLKHFNTSTLDYPQYFPAVSSPEPNNT